MASKQDYEAMARCLSNTRPRPAHVDASSQLVQADRIEEMGAGEALVEAFRKGAEAGKDPLTYQWEKTVHEMASYFANTNPRFNRAMFLKACGMDVEVPNKKKARTLAGGGLGSVTRG